MLTRNRQIERRVLQRFHSASESSAAPLSRGAWTRSERRCVLAEQLRPRTARDWEFHATELVRNATVHKPGWLAWEPGAVLELSIGSTRLASLRRRALPRLDARFLVSYEHMGAARLECVSGCDCLASTLQAHSADARVSVEGAYGVLVSQADDCVVRLTTLAESASPGGGHKFKLIGFTLAADHRGAHHVDDDDGGEDGDDDGDDDDDRSKRRGKRAKRGWT